MFISKINSVSSNRIGFKSTHTRINDVGEDVKGFNYLYDYKDGNEKCEIQIFKVKRLDNYNYKIDTTKPIKTIYLTPNGAEVNLLQDTNLDKDEAFVYPEKDEESGKYEGRASYDDGSVTARLGIDVSKFQGDIDWEVLKDQGISFAYIKATEGSGHVDTRLDANYQGARESGILYGFYHL